MAAGFVRIAISLEQFGIGVTVGRRAAAQDVQRLVAGVGDPVRRARCDQDAVAGGNGELTRRPASSGRSRA
jgi:hypothetical protein